MSLAFFISLFNAKHVSDVNTSILRSLRLIVDLFRGLYCSGTMCVGVTLWFGCGGVVSLCRLKQLATYCGFISWVVLLWFDVCWCYGVVRLGWCGILMQAEAACDLLWIYFMGCIALVRCVLVLRCGSAGVVWYPYAG